jgi:FSR family fosmidomycin resistance protein-like MFS transporter
LLSRLGSFRIFRDRHRRFLGVAAVAVALAIEFVDELADGTKGAALPLIRSDLGLSYSQIGLLISVPVLTGSLIELPLGLVAGQGKARHRLVLAGGAVVAGSLAAVAAAHSLAMLMVAFIAFFPASGAFVSLTQAALMDAAPTRHQQRMAAWNLAGSAGAVGGPLLLAGVLAVGGDWRTAYLVLAAAAVAALAVAFFSSPSRRATEPRADPDAGAGETDDERSSVREALRALRQGGVARWVVLLEISDLLLDVFTGYIGIYLVDVVGASPAEAAVGVAVRLGAGLAGDALFVLVSRRVSGPVALRVSALTAVVLYPAFLLVPSLPAKLAILALLSLTTACWYPVIQAGLYTSLPGKSGIAVFLSSAAAFAGAAGPIAVGLIAQQAGLTWALAVLGAAPAAVIAILPSARKSRFRRVKR